MDLDKLLMSWWFHSDKKSLSIDHFIFLYIKVVI